MKAHDCPDCAHRVMCMYAASEHAGGVRPPAVDRTPFFGALVPVCDEHRWLPWLTQIEAAVRAAQVEVAR